MLSALKRLLSCSFLSFCYTALLGSAAYLVLYSVVLMFRELADIVPYASTVLRTVLFLLWFGGTSFFLAGYGRTRL